MEEASGSDSGKPAPRFGFDFSWADEVEREEREQQDEEQTAVEQRREGERGRNKADPFVAARPREVVLAEKGVDWRARDRELEALAAQRGRSKYAASASAVRAPNHARIIPVPACDMSAPERHARLARRTPRSRRQVVESTPATGAAPPVCRSKRKSAGEAPVTAPVRRAPAAGDQGKRRMVFGELNVGEDCGSSFRSAAKRTCNSGGSKASEAVVADGGGSRGGCAKATTATTAPDESAVVQKRKGRKRGRRGGGAPKKT